MRLPVILTLVLGAILAAPALAQDPDLVTQGRVLLKNDEPEKALELFEKAAAADPKNTAAWIGAGEALIALGRSGEAVDAAEKALDSADDSAEAWLISARAYASQADQFAADRKPGAQIKLAYSSADKRAARALKLNSKTTGAWWIRAYAGMGMVDPGAIDYDSVMACLRKEIQLHPTGAFTGLAAFKLGTLLYGQSDPAGARDAFKAAVKADPKYALAWKWLASMQWRLGGKDDARKSYLEAAKLAPADNSARADLRTASIDGSNYARGVECFRSLLDAIGGLKSPGGTDVGRDLAWLLGRAKKTQEGLKLLDEIVRIDKNEYSFHLYRAEVLSAAGKTDALITELKKAIKLKPTARYTFDWLHRIGAARARSGDAAGFAMLEWLCETSPNANLANDLGLMFRDIAKNFPKSLKWYLVACELAPDDVGVLNDTGVIYQYHMGKPDEAEKLYRKVVKLGRTKHEVELIPGRAPLGYRDTLENLAALLIARDENIEEAEALLVELLELEPGRRVATNLLAQARAKLGR